MLGPFGLHPTASDVSRSARGRGADREPRVAPCLKATVEVGGAAGTRDRAGSRRRSSTRSPRCRRRSPGRRAPEPAGGGGHCSDRDATRVRCAGSGARPGSRHPVRSGSRCGCRSGSRPRVPRRRPRWGRAGAAGLTSRRQQIVDRHSGHRQIVRKRPRRPRSAPAPPPDPDSVSRGRPPPVPAVGPWPRSLQGGWAHRDRGGRGSRQIAGRRGVRVVARIFGGER